MILIEKLIVYGLSALLLFFSCSKSDSPTSPADEAIKYYLDSETGNDENNGDKDFWGNTIPSGIRPDTGAH